MPLVLDLTATAHSASVSASAGTGKTWLLVTRLVRLLIEGARPDAILAITFTRKAAAEMQERLAERLLDLATADDHRLHQQLAAMGIAPDTLTIDASRRLYEDLLRTPRPLKTTTFHAFCQELLRRFPLEANVPPGFELLDNTLELEQAARDALFGEAAQQPDGGIARALEYLFDFCGGLANTQTALSDFLQHRSDWWAYTASAQHPAAFAAARLRDQLKLDPDVDPTQTFLTAQRRAHLQEFTGLLRRHSTATHLQQADILDRCLEDAAELSAIPELLANCLLKADGTPLARKAGKALEKSLGAEAQARFLQLHESLCADLIDLNSALAARQTYAASNAWYKAGTRLLEHYQRLKLEQRVLDFADLEWKACQLLRISDNAHWVQYKLDQRIDHLLVDEFQDTNPTQWQLMLPLLEELAAGESERRRSVFIVGDIKQSIYRFRRAEPELFITAQEWLQYHLHAINQPLATSWRSAPAVMDLVNAVFGSGELHERLRQFTMHDTHHRDVWGRAEVLPLITDETDTIDTETLAVTGITLRHPLRQPRSVPEDTRHYREGQCIAAKIAELIAQPTIIYSGSQARPLACRDVLILLRQRTHVQHYERALREAGIPYAGAERGTLLETLEVRDMVALLEFLIAPFNNLALAQVLRSPVFACSEQHLMQLARTGKGSWLQRLEQLTEVGGADDQLREAARLLRHWHALAGALPVHDLLDRIYSEGDIYRRYEAAYPAHLRHRVHSSLTRFIELALEIDSGRYPSLGHFLARLETLRQHNDQAPDELPATADDRVRLMTIHAAKGLEAPLVFLADAAHVRTDRQAYQALVSWPASAAQPGAFQLLGKKATRDALSNALLEDDARAAAREDANLLYVALTRARQLLFISGCRPNRGEALGWYGLIHGSLSALYPVTDRGGIVIENGVMPDSSGDVSDATDVAAPDARLAERLSISPLARNIVPSRQVTHSGNDRLSEADAQLRGIAIHRLLQLLCEGVAADTISARVAAELGIDTGHSGLARWLIESRNVFATPALQFLFDPTQYQAAYNEVPLIFRHEKETVHGIIDRVVMSDANNAWIVDYKTASAQDWQALAQVYRPQLVLYREGARQLWPERKIHTAVLFTPTAQLITLEGFEEI